MRLRIVASLLAVPLLLVASVAPAQLAEHVESEPLEHLEVLTGGALASDPLPMVVMLHGRGDDPARWSDRIPAQIPERSRVILIRAPLALGTGFEWFRYMGQGTPAGPISFQVARVAPRVIATIDRIAALRPTVGRPIVSGFSQGAMLTYALALMYPERIAAAYPVAGFLLPRLIREMPEDAGRVPPIVAFHGTRDRIIPIESDRRTVRVLRARGVEVELREHDGVGHTLEGISGALMRELRAAITRESGTEAPGALSSR